MNKNQILNTLATVTETDEVLQQPDLDMYDTQVLDSMRIVDLIIALEQEYGVIVAPVELDREAWRTPARFAEDVLGRLAFA